MRRDGLRFSVMFKDEKVADVYICGIRESKIVRYTDVPYKQPFRSGKNDFLCVYDFLKSRCYGDGRADLPEIMAAVKMKYNDPWKWNMITHGVTYDDFFGVRFQQENLTWKEVRLRE